MNFIYTFSIHTFGWIMRVISFFNRKAKLWIQGRTNLFEQLPPIKNREVYWFHCASLGEFDQGLPLMNLLREKKTDAFILLTFFSPSGLIHYHKRKHPVDFACYLPLDTVRNAKKMVQHFNPSMVFFVKYEFWSNLIFELKKNDSKIYSISTLLRPDHRFFKWYGAFFRKTLKQFDYFFAQNHQTKDLLEKIGLTNSIVSGDTRYDRVIENKNQLVQDELISNFVESSQSVFIVGSSWPKDESILKQVIGSDLFEKYIIAPHNIDEIHVQNLIETIRKPVIRYSDVENNSANQASILILDTIGLLASAYSFGQVAYVGGGFSKSLHNILEPAVFGLPVVFGPIHHRFPEAQAFINEGIGFSVSNEQALKEKLAFIHANYDDIHQRSVAFIRKNQGAAKKIMEELF